MSKTSNFSFVKLDDGSKVIEPGDYNTMLDTLDSQVGSPTAVVAAYLLTGLAAAQGGSLARTGGTSSTTGNAGGAVTDTGGTPGATGVGGAVGQTGGAGGSTSGVGGAANNIGGAGTAGNSAGGVATNAGGAGQGSAAGGVANNTGGVGGATGNGGKASNVGGAGGATSGVGGIAENIGGASGVGTTGTGGAAKTVGGASLASNGNGGDAWLVGGALAGTGKEGVAVTRGVVTSHKQVAPTAKTVTAAITAAELVTGIITTTGATAPSIHQLPTGTLLLAEVPNFIAGDSFDFSVINTGTGASDDATITVNTDVTIVGNPTAGALTDATIISGSARFRARYTGGVTWIVYRLA